MRTIAAIVVIAAAPLPFFAVGGLLARGDLVWLLLANLAVATASLLVGRDGASLRADDSRRWSFERGPARKS